MQFVSLAFLLLLPVAALINFIIPRKFRYIWLLAISAAFYISIDLKASAVMAGTVVVTYFAALLIEKVSGGAEEKRTKGATALLVLAVVVEVAAMLIFRSGKIMGAIGISFYMLKSLGYIIDVYRGDEVAEHNFLKLALFVSFFPQVISGPIERAGNMLPQFSYPVTVDFDRMRDGFLQMLWGYFLKLVIADRIAIYVNSVFEAPDTISGTLVAIGTVLYSFEIYCDFAGYSAIAIGCARILGIDVMKNFDSPYMAKSIAEFWRRWHISLSTWLRDYVYIPLGGNRKGTVRKYLNVLIVFAVSGIWHGSALTFLVWGLLHGVYQIIGFVTMPLRDKVVEALKIDRSGLSHRTVKTIITFLLVNLAWIFFRAESLEKAFTVIKKSLEFTPWVFSDGSLFELGLTQGSMNIAVLGIILLIVMDILAFNGVEIRDKIIRQSIWYRWIIMIAGILAILIFGVWGAGYNAASFIYQQF
ncbi:MBOAT family protein [Butyrivibrio sp. CB08]|uniref:MBOAT family O-acyltransferase n=1 Tax=Butyrivibrio sp. CB08 TaxID=2364879 RepID=UPI000EAAA691|nr:MBOAT family O-acyltransferase [Butyrivibrio sp. CB08]RKM57846.1 MBOAT family protein [Butyrivibrio sp. CB08]